MRFRTLLVAALVVSLGSVAFAELQNVEIGGNIRIRGNYYNLQRSDTPTWLGRTFEFFGLMDRVRRTRSRTSFVEQRTRLNVKADFTQDVSAFIEFDYYHNWGDDFRSNYLTGADWRGGQNNNVDLYQGYIEAKDMWGTPLAMRVGRQELAFGNQLLVGVNDTSSLYTGLSFDALRLSFANDVVSIDAVAAKLAENYGNVLDDDVDLYALYLSYIGIEDVALDAYWLFIRDDMGAIANIIRGTTVDLHTIGLRGAGVINAFDFELEAAYQFGDVDGVPNPWFRLFNREADVDFSEFTVNAEVGYTFDATWYPRVFARFAYIGGGSPNRSCWNNNATLPFNRLFSNVRYSELLDIQQQMSNVLFYSLGVQAMPTEALELKLAVSYFHADNRDRSLDRRGWWGSRRGRGWWGRRTRSRSGIGWEAGIEADYHYSEDLVIRAGYSHFFSSSSGPQNFIATNGLARFSPRLNRWLVRDTSSNYHYLFVETEVSF